MSVTLPVRSFGCMIGANSTFLKTMGYSRSDVEERKLIWQTLIPPEYNYVSRREVEKFLATTVCQVHSDKKEALHVLCHCTVPHNRCIYAAMKHFSYMVVCKAFCGSRLFVRYIGEFPEDHRVEGGSFVFPVEVTCFKCKHRDMYGVLDLKVGITPERPPYKTNLLETTEEVNAREARD
jgi:hypothetical protein